MSNYANIPDIKEQTGWRVSFWLAVSNPLVDVSLGLLAATIFLSIIEEALSRCDHIRPPDPLILRDERSR